MSSAIKLIVGLGNPGPEHLLTRHNAGFWFVDVIARQNNLQFRAENKFHSEMCRLQYAGHDCWLCKPATFMNRSGSAVQAIADYYKINPGEILIAHDEIDLDPGIVRLKQGGGHAGHNGVRDIIEKLGNAEFNRLRIGVGHPGASSEVINSVLGRPTAEEEDLIMESISRAAEILPQILAGEFQKAMHKLHTTQQNETSDEPQEDENND